MSTPPFLPGQLRIILAITSVYLIIWFAYFSQTPAGQYPTETGLQTLNDALARANGHPTDATSSSLYTQVLSIVAHDSLDLKKLANIARGINAFGLICLTGLATAAARNYWKMNRAVWATGLFLGLNPVLIFWAYEPTPTLLATLCMSLAVWRFHPWLRRPKIRISFLISLSLCLAAAFETALLPLAIAWIFVARMHPKREKSLHVIAAMLGPIAFGSLFIVSNLQLQSPLTFDLSNIGIKSYQALASKEPLDTRNFGLYRQLHLLLFMNPIHWGLLLVLAVGGAYARLKDGHNPRSIQLAGLTLALFALSFALLDGTGSQSRATILPLLAFFAAGGVCLLPKTWKHASRRTRRNIKIGATATICFAYAGSVLGKSATAHWERDYVFLANANIQLGNENLASKWAKKALELKPENAHMSEVITIARFKDWAISNKQRSLPTKAVKENLEFTQTVNQSPMTKVIQGIYHYKIRETETALQLWRAHAHGQSLAALCLYWTGHEKEAQTPTPFDPANNSFDALFLDAKAANRNNVEYTKIEQLLDNMLSFTY